LQVAARNQRGWSPSSHADALAAVVDRRIAETLMGL